MNATRITVLIAILLFSRVSDAASVTVYPLSSLFPPIPDELVTFEIVIDFTEMPTLGGGFDVTFNEEFLSLVSFTEDVILGDPAFGRPPDYVPGKGLLESWGVGDFNGISLGVVGQVQFKIISPITGYDPVFVIGVGPTQGVAGPWVSAVDFTTIIEPQYNEITIVRIPLPGAFWLMLSAIGFLVSTRRRRIPAG